MLSTDGRYLFALNTAADRLEIFDAQGETLRSIGETTVGLRPVALALSDLPTISVYIEILERVPA